MTPGPRTGDAAEMDAFRAYLDGIEALAAPRRLEDLNPADYDAVFIPGGHGPMQDLSVSDDLGRLLVTVLDTPGKIVSTVCHGAAGLLPALRTGGRWAFDGRHLTGFTNDEETRTGAAAKASWLLEDRLRAAGGKFDAGEPFSSHVIVDGGLVTGQNPASSVETAQHVLDLLAA
jgi:putative intracellular protease/amidase